MADISQYLQAIMQAVYGEEVRGSIHDAIDEINKVSGKVLTIGIAVTSESSSIEGFYKDSLYINSNTDDLWKCTGTAWALQGNIRGSSISSISKTGTSGLVDTYTITLTNGVTSTFTVTNGYSPTVTIGTKVGRDQPVTFTDKDGSETIHIMDGLDATGSTISSLDDVNITSIADEQYLEYDSTASKWKNVSLDSTPSLTSGRPLQNQKVTKLVGVEIGPVHSDSTNAGGGKTLVEFTDNLITNTAEIHLIQNNGEGSSNNANPTSWDTPVFYNSFTVDSANHKVTYEFNDSTLVQNTDFYLKVITEFYTITPSS